MRSHPHLILAGLTALALLLGGCSPTDIAVSMAPAKTPSSIQSPKARQANARFWEALHGGRYEEVPAVIHDLTAAYLENPRDTETAAHLGFAHVWRLSEAPRLKSIPPNVTDDIVMAHKYFDEAVELAPDDQRFRGFRAAMEMAEGQVHDDERLERRGYFDMMDAVAGWPEFNLFTAGYVMSRLPFSDSRYNEAVNDQWRNLDACAGETVDRQTGDFSKYMANETTVGPKRACWNSWIAPHNFEGFFLNMGDMLVKQGNPGLARNVYANAKRARTYQEWPYKHVLEQRIAHADENVAFFRADAAGAKGPTIMFNSAFSCVACHQK